MGQVCFTIYIRPAVYRSSGIGGDYFLPLWLFLARNTWQALNLRHKSGWDVDKDEATGFTVQ